MAGIAHFAVMSFSQCEEQEDGAINVESESRQPTLLVFCGFGPVATAPCVR
jgi:hypothetical protein